MQLQQFYCEMLLRNKSQTLDAWRAPRDMIAGSCDARRLGINPIAWMFKVFLVDNIIQFYKLKDADLDIKSAYLRYAPVITWLSTFILRILQETFYLFYNIFN